MGCDIHSYVEVLHNGKNRNWGYVEYGRDKWGDLVGPFEWRDYGVFAVLAGVRNYSGVPTIQQPRGLPEGLSTFVAKQAEEEGDDGHTHSWYLLKELLDFDWDAEVEDRRTTKEIRPGLFDGGCTTAPGEGVKMTYRAFMGQPFFKDLDKLKTFGKPDEVRIVFWFDN